MKAVAALGPKLVIITDGTGARIPTMAPIAGLCLSIRTSRLNARAPETLSPPQSPQPRMGKTLEEALLWAPINSMSVTLFVGAQEGLLTQNKIEEYLKNAPADYKPVKI